MGYEINLDDIFEINGQDYITLDITELDGVKYCFTNRLLSDEEPSKDFFVFKMLPQGLVKEKDTEKLNAVLKIFSANMNKKIEYMNSLKEQEGSGE